MATSRASVPFIRTPRPLGDITQLVDVTLWGTLMAINWACECLGRTQVKITLDQFEHGQLSKHGTPLVPRLGLSRKRIVGILKELERRGWITIERRPDGNRYALTLPASRPLPPVPSDTPPNSPAPLHHQIVPSDLPIRSSSAEPSKRDPDDDDVLHIESTSDTPSSVDFVAMWEACVTAQNSKTPATVGDQDPPSPAPSLNDDLLEQLTSAPFGIARQRAEKLLIDYGLERVAAALRNAPARAAHNPAGYLIREIQAGDFVSPRPGNSRIAPRAMTEWSARRTARQAALQAQLANVPIVHKPHVQMTVVTTPDAATCAALWQKALARVEARFGRSIESDSGPMHSLVELEYERLMQAAAA